MNKEEKLGEATLKRLEEKVMLLLRNLEEMDVKEYIELRNNPWRMIYVNFMGGVVRGFGMAVGFTLLGAFVLYILKQMAILNLPLISNWIAEIVRLVQEQS